MCQAHEGERRLGKGRDYWSWIADMPHSDDEAFGEYFKPVFDGPSTFIGVRQIAKLEGAPSSFIVEDRDGHGAWVRDCHMVCLPDLMYVVSDAKTAAGVYKD